MADIEWHPYPAEIPQRDGEYIVQVVTTHNDVYVRIAAWLTEDFTDVNQLAFTIVSWREIGDGRVDLARLAANITNYHFLRQ